MMDDLEKQLKAALQKQDPSPFFEARVLGAAKRQAAERRTSARLWWASAMAAAILVLAGAAWQYQKAREEQAAGEQAKARLELALKVASVKLQRISIQVEGIQQ